MYKCKFRWVSLSREFTLPRTPNPRLVLSPPDKPDLETRSHVQHNRRAESTTISMRNPTSSHLCGVRCRPSTQDSRGRTRWEIGKAAVEHTQHCARRAGDGGNQDTTWSDPSKSSVPFVGNAQTCALNSEENTGFPRLSPSTARRKAGTTQYLHMLQAKHPASVQ